MRRKKLLALVLSLTMVAGLTACGSKPQESAPVQSGTETEEEQETEKETETVEASDREELRVGTMALTMGVPVLYAEEKGYFEEAGLNVSIELFATGAPINEAIAAEQIDIAVSGFASVYSLANADCTWLADVNTTGGMGLFARADSAIAQNTAENGLIGDAEPSGHGGSVYDRILCREIWPGALRYQSGQYGVRPRLSGVHHGGS